MSWRKQTRGDCGYCGKAFTKSGMIKHLSGCPQRLAIVAASDEQSGEKETLVHLRFQDAWPIQYWMNLEMRGSATLGPLDKYLQAIWLECCGHLSRFSAGD